MLGSPIFGNSHLESQHVILHPFGLLQLPMREPKDAIGAVSRGWPLAVEDIRAVDRVRQEGVFLGFTVIS